VWTTIGARLRSPCDADNASDATGDGRVSQGGRWVAGVLERNGREGQENTVSRRRRQGVCDMICWLSWRSGVRERAPHRSRGPASTPLEVLETREHVRSTIFPCDHMPFLNRDNSTHRSRMKRTAWINSTVVSNRPSLCPIPTSLQCPSNNVESQARSEPSCTHFLMHREDAPFMRATAADKLGNAIGLNNIASLKRVVECWTTRTPRTESRTSQRIAFISVPRAQLCAQAAHQI
jgi:hypothetical protein